MHGFKLQLGHRIQGYEFLYNIEQFSCKELLRIIINKIYLGYGKELGQLSLDMSSLGGSQIAPVVLLQDQGEDYLALAVGAAHQLLDIWILLVGGHILGLNDRHLLSLN